MTKNSFTLVVIFFLLLSISTKTLAWGSKGHAYVVEVAFHYLDDTTKKIVMNYLDGMSIEKSGNWMDAIKSDHANDYMKPYHYIDIEKGGKEIPKGDNIITALNRTLKELDNKNNMSREEIKRHILFLLHLIGDLHQPLHIGYPGDKGGNDIKLNFLGSDSNLHSVWDSGIIEHTNMLLSDILKVNTYTPEQQAAIQKINIIAWATQTRGYLKNVYAINDNKINEFYVDENAKIIKSQLLNAGLRLASVLQHYFHNDTPPSVALAMTEAPPIAINIAQAADYEGQMVTVCSKVYGTKYMESSKSKPTFLDLGADYPNELLTVFIEEVDRANFTNKPEDFYKNKEVCITGKIKRHKGRVEINVTKQDEIKLN